MARNRLRGLLATTTIAVMACQAENPIAREVQVYDSSRDTPEAEGDDASDSQFGRPDFPCDCFYPSFEIIVPDNPEPQKNYTIDLCAPLQEERLLSLTLKVNPCALCGPPTCLFNGVDVCRFTRPSCPDAEAQEAAELGLEVFIPPRDDGSPQTDIGYGQDGEFALEVIYRPTKASAIDQDGAAIPDEVLLNVLLDCGPSHPPPPIWLHLTAFEDDCPP
jgi:hypothetical protein